MDEGCLSGAWGTVEEVSAAEGNAAGGVPGFGSEEVIGVREEKVLDPWIKDDGTQGPFWAGGEVSPTNGSMVN